jgi:hypothetical protein
MPHSNSARFFIALIVLSGVTLLGFAGVHASSDNLVRFLSFLLVACVAARLRVKLPGVTGSMSVNLPFILAAVAQMSAAEALAVGCLSTLVQCLPRAGRKFNLVQAAFNVANMALAVSATRWVFNSAGLGTVVTSQALRLGIAAAGFYAVNTVPVAIIIALTESKNALQVWVGMLQLSFPYYLASAGVAGVALTVAARLGWEVPILVLPLMLGMFYSYRHYFLAAAETQVQRETKASSVARAT